MALDRYRMDSQLGSGSFGEVWRAVDTVTDQPVAIKVIPEADSDVLTEVRNLQAVASECLPNNVVCYKGMVQGEDGGATAIVMSLAPGVTLNNAELASERRMRKWAQQLFQALSYLHSRGIVHRDVKPGNIMVDGDDLMLIDLGIACSRCDTTYQGVVGTPEYMMPTLIAAMEEPGGAYISKRDLMDGDMWSAAEALIQQADRPGPTVALLKQLQEEAEAMDEAGVRASVANLTRASTAS